MKKFTFALIAAAFAFCANAATVSWTTPKGYLYDGAGDSAAKITSGTAYLVSTDFSRSDLVALFVSLEGDTAVTLTKLQEKTGYLGSGTIGDNARIMDGTGMSSAETDISAYFVVFNGSKMFVSGTADSVFDGLAKNHDIAFATISASSKETTTVGSTGTFGSASWYSYSTTPVPEPTTVALLALGLAAVGLKRKLA